MKTPKKLNNIVTDLNATKARMDEWARHNFLGIVILNISLMILFMLHSAGYFEPYLPVTINLVILFGIIIMRLVLRINSNILFGLALCFMFFALILKVLHVDVWAERTMIYCYEAFFISTVGLFIDQFFTRE